MTERPPWPRFDTTQWSLIIQAKHRSSPEGRAAFAELCRRYWYPLYGFVRSRGYSFHQAQDLTQGFFERVLEKNYVGDVDPSRGRFRTFLLVSMNHFLANEYDKTRTLKRGGNRQHLSLEYEVAEQRFAVEPASGLTAEQRFEQSWARSVLDRVIGQLRDDYKQAGKLELFEALKPMLTAESAEKSATVARRLSMNSSAVRVAIHRLRTRYRDRLRAEVLTTLTGDDELEDEIAALFDAFSPKDR